MRFNDKNNTTMTKAKLVNGVVLQVGGIHYTNANLTDEVARAFLSAFPMRKDWFAELPADEVKVEKQPTAPKEEKSAKNRK